MKVEFGKLLEGIGNAIFIKEEIEKIAAERIAICELCSHYSPNAKLAGATFTRKDKFCLDCGCNMYLKTRALSAFCPLGSATSHFPNEVSKWPAITTDGQVSDVILETPEIKKDLDDYKMKLMHNKLDEHQ
jgi:hypothetical protein